MHNTSDSKLLSLVGVAKQYLTINDTSNALWALQQIESAISAQAIAPQRRMPNVIFCNLVCSGSSGIDPILKEILSSCGYYITPFNPEGTCRLHSEVIGKHEPFYHWTHDPLSTFSEEITDEENYKFIFLHRDPRDVAISIAHDWQKHHPHLTYRTLLTSIIVESLPRIIDHACIWANCDKALIITFEEFKANCLNLVSKILLYLNLDFEHSVSDPYSFVHALVHKYSYENVAGRKRGDEGAILRTGYMHRKGISGDWKNHFDAELKSLFKKHLGRELIELGYETSDDW